MSLFLPKSRGVLGINARNLNYLGPYNPRKAVMFADDKLKTKVFLETRGIPVPKLYAKIANRDELRAFDFDALPDTCVLKPNFGYGGEGIIVLKGREDGWWKTGSGGRLSSRELFEHIEDILDGMYSINHRRDIAFFEQLILPADFFAPLKPAGLPDIRIVVHNLVPVMAMLRLPTEESGGRANLHAGGIGLGIDLAKGVTTFAVRHDRLIEALPDGKEPSGLPRGLGSPKALRGFKIPHWNAMLLVASRIQQMTNIGFLGVDLTVDKSCGPLLLEVNARAGLAVQLANLAPLKDRLERVEGLKVGSPEKGVRIAQDLFGEKIEAKANEEKPVLATREMIEIVGGRKPVTAPVILRPDHDRTIFSPSLISELRALDAVDEEERGRYRVKFLLGGRKLQTVVSAADVKEKGVRASLGKRDLTGFLVDPTKKPGGSPGATTDLTRIDRQLCDIDRRIQLLRNVRPDNIEEERARAERDSSHNPVFTYAELSFDSAELLDRLQYLAADRSALGQLLERKRLELTAKIRLLEARGDSERFTQASVAVFGGATRELVSEARGMVRTWKETRETRESGESGETLHQSSSTSSESGAGQAGEMLSAEEVKEIFEEVLSGYGLRDWNVRLKEETVSDCSIGRRTLFLRNGARFSRERIGSLVAHEIETHVLTAENGEKQPYELFACGCAGYLGTQEGLAVHNQNAVLPEGHEKRYWPALGVLAVHYGARHSFAELRRYIRRLGFDDARALRTCFKVKRGLCDTSQPGAFTREIVYFRGWKAVSEYLEGGGDMRELYRGKVNLRDIGLVRRIPGILDPLYLPRQREASRGG